MRRTTSFFIVLTALAVLMNGDWRRAGFSKFGASSAQTKQTPPPIRWLKSFAPFSFKTADGEIDRKIEPSAVEPIGDGTFLLIADDKDDPAGKSLAIVETATGKVVKRLQLPTVEKNPKWEAMAKDGEDFYVVGSHAVNAGDSAEKLKNRSRLFRFRLKNIENPPNIEIDRSAAALAELDITESLRALNLYDANPKRSRVKIEGLAVRRINDKRQLIVGLREPSENASVYLADLGNSSKLELKPFFSFAAGEVSGSDETQNVAFKLSSIEYFSPWQGFFLVTSTEDASNRFYGNALWFVGDDAIANAISSGAPKTMPLVNPQMIRVFGTKMKAEGWCLFPQKLSESKSAETFSAAIVFDNDTEDTFSQLSLFGTLQIIELSRR